MGTDMVKPSILSEPTLCIDFDLTMNYYFKSPHPKVGKGKVKTYTENGTSKHHLDTDEWKQIILNWRLDQIVFQRNNEMSTQWIIYGKQYLVVYAKRHK